MHPHGIEVLDGADDDHVIIAVAHHLQLVLFPPDQRFLDEYFGDHRVLQSPGGYFSEFIEIVGYSASRSAQSKAGPDDAGQTDFPDHFVQALSQ